MRENKECAECGGIFFRPERYRAEQWAARRFCSVSCAGRANARAARAKKTGGKKAVEEVAVPVPGEVAEVVLAPEPALGKEPVMRDLRVVRVGPNPRILVCEYFELAQRRVCLVNVKRNDKFTRGMRMRMAEPVEELAFRRPWVYQGPAPRRKGRW